MSLVALLLGVGFIVSGLNIEVVGVVILGSLLFVASLALSRIGE